MDCGVHAVAAGSGQTLEIQQIEEEKALLLSICLTFEKHESSSFDV
jgi:hypothetical protein